MAFDVNQYRNARVLSPVEKITTAVTTNMTGVGRDQYVPVAQHAATSMIENGLGESNLIGVVARRTDGVDAMNASYGRDLYGDNTMRATPAAITKARLNYTASLQYYEQEVNPASKIERKKQQSGINVMVAM